MATSPLLEASIEIDAPPTTVWAIVSDLKGMGERSPQAWKVLSVGAIKRGTIMVNINKQGGKVWPTTARVVTFDPLQEIAFKIMENGSVWAYTLSELDGGSRTKLVEQRRAPNGTTKLSQFLIKKAMGGDERFERALVKGMERTLTTIKAEAERA